MSTIRRHVALHSKSLYASRLQLTVKVLEMKNWWLRMLARPRLPTWTTTVHRWSQQLRSLSPHSTCPLPNLYLYSRTMRNSTLPNLAVRFYKSSPFRQTRTISSRIIRMREPTRNDISKRILRQHISRLMRTLQTRTWGAWRPKWRRKPSFQGMWECSIKCWQASPNRKPKYCTMIRQPHQIRLTHRWLILMMIAELCKGESVSVNVKFENYPLEINNFTESKMLFACEMCILQLHFFIAALAHLLIKFCGIGSTYW